MPLPADRHPLDGPITVEVGDAFARVDGLRQELAELSAALPHLHRIYERARARVEQLPAEIEAARRAANDLLSRTRAGLIRTLHEEG